MRNLIIILAFLSLTQVGHSQFSIGVKGGISALDVGVDSLNIKDPQSVDRFVLNIEDANYGFFFGLVFQMRFDWFLIQPEVIFNSNSVDFKLQDKASTQASKIFNETYQNLDIPFLLGLKAGPLRIHAGPVGHVFINSISELKDLEGYKRKFNDIEYGYIAGLGIDFFKIMIDVRYEGNLSRFGNHFNFFDKQYNFSQNPTRLMASVAIILN